MKKVIISILFCLATVYTFGQDFSMYLRGRKISYEVSTTKMLVKMKSHDITSVKKVLQNPLADNLKKIDDVGDGLFYLEMKNTSEEGVRKIQRQLNSREDVIYTSPVFGNEREGYANEVIVMLKSKDDYPVLLKYANVYHIKDIRIQPYSGETYILTLPHNPEKDAMQTALDLYETGLFEYAEPNGIHLFPYATNDTYFGYQWNLQNTGQSGGRAGIDIKAVQAWGTTVGSSSMKIAIVDTGVDRNHPDLINNLLWGYDAYTHSDNGGAPTSTASGDFPHGTKCAGVVAAQGSNSKGIVGVAYGSKILPVTAGANGYINASAAAEGINWAWHNGADIISMSYGSYTVYNNEELALDSARIYGRGNKGCILVACSHNYEQPNVTFPASNANVMAVGAISATGQRPNYSNYGPKLSVVAPGEGIYTTCMLGTTENIIINDGANGVYTSNFSGTSAATPHVAGIAALILSKNSTLAWQEVRNIIEMTCRKLDNYVFETTSAHPNGSWNNEVGYGLVDAQAAVQAATCTNSLTSQTISLNKFARNCTNNFLIQNVTVTNNAKLTVKSNEVSINGTFTANTGGQFEIR